MIQATELRIGNLVKYCASFVEITSVPKIKLETIYFNFGSNENYCAYISEIIPIPITEEWLLKFGFEQRDHLWSINIDRYNKINYNSDQNILFSGQLGFSIQHDIKYIHQLQNLYFALTGEELTLSVT